MSTQTIVARLNSTDKVVSGWLARHSLTLLRISVGIVFVWFGALKLVPGLSPAEPLIRASITFLPMDLFLPVLAILEMTIGVGFILGGKFKRITIILLLGQMAGAMSPIVLRPDLIFTHFPYALTLEGQYIIKDIILISAGLVVGATVRGGGLVADPSALAASLKRRTVEVRSLLGMGE
ncbi:MAG: hypothetical protein H7175_06235 [Burkholderiales bacterium]|nr:hypothetical protein [Anaerolineae bacterium]